MNYWKYEYNLFVFISLLTQKGYINGIHLPTES
jgi:hypothetical protein